MEFLHGYDEAFVGIAERNGRPVACYSMRRVVEIMMERDGMSEQGAEEYVGYNFAGSHGAGSPVLVEDCALEYALSLAEHEV